MSNDGRLAGKVAVVTGGGNGLGRATAVRFAEEGAAVVVADLLDGPGHETVAQIEAGGGRAAFVSVDVTSRADNDAMARTAIEQFDGLHIVVTAAGVATGGYVSGDLELAQKSIARALRTRSGAGVRQPRHRRLAVGARHQPHRHPEVLAVVRAARCSTTAARRTPS